jgi:hypothetical protein
MKTQCVVLEVETEFVNIQQLEVLGDDECIYDTGGKARRKETTGKTKK